MKNHGGAVQDNAETLSEVPVLCDPNKAFSVMAELTSFSPPTQKSELPHGTGPTSGRPFANAGQSTFGKLHLKFLC